MARAHVVSTHGDDYEPYNDDVAEDRLIAVDPDLIWLGTSEDLDSSHHRNDYFVQGDTADLHAALRTQDEPYQITKLGA